jgi:hypothetical protein
LSWGTAIVEWSAMPTKPAYSVTWGRRKGEYALAGLRRPLVRWWRRLMLLSPTTWIITARKVLNQRREQLGLQKPSSEDKE